MNDSDKTSNLRDRLIAPGVCDSCSKTAKLYPVFDTESETYIAICKSCLDKKGLIVAKRIQDIISE